MLKIRITGLPDEMERFLNELRKRFFVSKESKACKDSNSRYYRKYVNAEERNKK